MMAVTTPKVGSEVPHKMCLNRQTPPALHFQYSEPMASDVPSLSMRLPDSATESNEPLVSGQTDCSMTHRLPSVSLIRFSEKDGEEDEGVPDNAMGTSISYIQPESSDWTSTYFGPASTNNFRSLFRRIVAKSGRLSMAAESFRAAISWGLSSGRRQQPRSESLQSLSSKHSTAAFHVPPCREADALPGKYWTWDHTLYPFLHRPSFEQRYMQLWQPSTCSSNILDDTLIHCMLTTLLSLCINPARGYG